MEDKTLLLFIWSKEVNYAPKDLVTINHTIFTNQSALILLAFTPENMLYWHKDLGISNELLKLCDTDIWEGHYKECSFSCVAPEDPNEELEYFIRRNLEQLGYSVLVRHQS